jgi:hypothetical protein
MTAECNFEGCTFGETGICALERDPASCDHRINMVSENLAEEAQSDLGMDDGELGLAVLGQPDPVAALPPSHTFGPDALSRMMASRYVTVVGILGDPDSGKTACLASTYLLVANAMLEGFTFADSQSLMGFEEIARGARDWNKGSPPEQMTMHTETSDDRRAGFLHLRLVRKSDGRRFDLALPDLPGEWTMKLVTSNQAARFEFVKASDVVWIVLDGRALADKERRQGVIYRVGQLADRLRTLCQDRLPRVLIVVTHRDIGPLAESVSARLLAELNRKSVEATIVQVAPFSGRDSVRAGHGISSLIDATVGAAPVAPDFWPDGPTRKTSRSFIKFRRNR